MRPEWAVEVKFGGSTEQYIDEHNRLRVRWVPHKIVIGVPYDTPILGYRTNTANTLRLWRSEAPESFDFAIFNSGDYYGAVNQKVASENLSKVLYPNDEQLRGKELRLEQQYFFVSCSLQDMLRILRTQKLPVDKFHEKFAVQLNDTHPAIAIAEFMRLLVDESLLPWADAWKVTCQTFAYTNHTLLPEALERWSLEVFGRVLPRHLQIIYEINAQFLEEVRMRFLGDEARIARMSLIDETGERYVRMAHLACVGSHAINGVAELHSELLKRDVLEGLLRIVAAEIQQQDQRRDAAALDGAVQSEALGAHFRAHRRRAGSRTWRSSRAWNRWRRTPSSAPAGARSSSTTSRHLPPWRCERTGIVIDPDSMFDVLVKRIHEYKRQHLKVLHIVSLYHRIKSNPALEVQPRTFIFGGKAAPGYHLAKLMIKLITAVGDVVNRDPDVRDRLKVVFLPNFNVTNGQRVYPAADLSEQISTAGKEASGTGNMKFSMNGALTIGTLDGANIEIREEVGAENFFLFGLSADGSLCPEGARVSADGLLQRQSGTARGDRPHPQRLFLARRHGAVPAADRRPAAPGPVSAARGFPVLCRLPGQGVARPTATPSAGRACRSSIPRAAASSHPIAPFANTARISGTSNRCRSTCSHMRKQESHSPAQRLRGAPQQLIAHGKGGQIFSAHGQFAQAADGDVSICR